MKSSTDETKATVTSPTVEGIYLDLFEDARRLSRKRAFQTNASQGDCDYPNDCDCDCAPQCPDCDCN